MKVTNNAEKINIPSNENDKDAIRQVLDLISIEYSKIEMARNTINEEIKALSEKYELPTKIVRKIAKTYHRQSFDDEKSEMENFENLYYTIVENNVTD